MTPNDPRHACSSFYNDVPAIGSCIDALAEGSATLGDLCPTCTSWFVMVIDHGTGRRLRWHHAYSDRSRA